MCTIKDPRGSHNFRVVNMAYYEGNWEEHSKTNEYSLDTLYESSINLKKKHTLDLVFDIDKETTIAKLK